MDWCLNSKVQSRRSHHHESKISRVSITAGLILNIQCLVSKVTPWQIKNQWGQWWQMDIYHLSASSSSIPQQQGSLGHYRWFRNQFSPFSPVLRCPLVHSAERAELFDADARIGGWGWGVCGFVLCCVLAVCVFSSPQLAELLCVYLVLGHFTSNLTMTVIAFACMCIHTHTHSHTHTCQHTHIHTHTHTCQHTHIHTHTHTCQHTHIHTHTHTHTCQHTHIHTRTYSDTCTHTHTWTHIWLKVKRNRGMVRCVTFLLHHMPICSLLCSILICHKRDPAVTLTLTLTLILSLTLCIKRFLLWHIKIVTQQKNEQIT